MEAAPRTPLEMPEPDLLLEFLMVAFDAPAQLGDVDQTMGGRDHEGRSVVPRPDGVGLDRRQRTKLGNRFNCALSASVVVRVAPWAPIENPRGKRRQALPSRPV